MFPGRFLEEIDQTDTARAIRARLARGYEMTEERRKMFFDKKIKDLTPEEWRRIQIMDSIAEDLGI